MDVVQQASWDIEFGPTKPRGSALFFVWVMVHHTGSHRCHFFHLSIHPLCTDPQEFALVCYLEIIAKVDNVDRALKSLSLGLEADNDIDHSDNFNMSFSGTDEVKEWYELVPFSTELSVRHIVRSIYSAPLFFQELPWPFPQCYVNKFYSP